MTKLQTKLLAWVAGTAIALPMFAFAQASADGASKPASAKLSTEKAGTSAASKAKTFFGEPFAGRWSFTAQTSASAEYDDNVFSSDVNRQGDITSRFSIRVSAAVQKKRLKFQAHYFPNYVLYRRYSDRNAWTHQFGQQLTYRVSARTDLNWNTSASRIASSANTPFMIVEFDGVNEPVFHPETLQTDTTITTVNNTFGWSHRFSARNTLKINTDGSFTNFESVNGVPLLTTLANKNFAGGADVDWETEIVPRRKIGVQVGEKYLGFLNPSSHSQYQFVKLRFSQEFSHGLHFSVGAGPSRREDQLQFAGAASANLDFAMDATFSKSAERHSVGLTYHHGSQQGLTQESLSSDNFSVFATQKLRRRWVATAGFSYSRSVTVGSVQQSTDSFAPNGSLSYQISPELNATLNYSYINQSGLQSSASGQGFDRNLFSIGVQYSFDLLRRK